MKLNVLQVTTDFGQGGAERVFSQLSAELAMRYHVIDCVFNKSINQQYQSGNFVVDLGTPATDNYFIKIYHFFLRIHRLRQIKKKFNIHVTISHLEGADYINILSRYHDKVILCIHGSKIYDKDIGGAVGWLRKKILIPYLYKKSDHIVTVSLGIKAELKKHFRLDDTFLKVIPNFFEVDLLEKRAKEKLPEQYVHLFNNYEVLITTGRLASQKNQQLLIDLMPELMKTRPRIKLLLLGDGLLYDNLKAKAKQLKLKVQGKMDLFDENNDVFFLGYVGNPFSFLRSATIFLLPSLWEGFPLALCEAMVCGVPVIAHDCPTGPREIIAPHVDEGGELKSVLYTVNGALIPIGEPYAIQGWMEAILLLLNDETQRKAMVVKGRQRIEFLRKESIMPQWFDLIDSIK